MPTLITTNYKQKLFITTSNFYKAIEDVIELGSNDEKVFFCPMEVWEGKFVRYDRDDEVVKYNCENN